MTDGRSARSPRHLRTMVVNSVKMRYRDEASEITQFDVNALKGDDWMASGQPTRSFGYPSCR